MRNKEELLKELKVAEANEDGQEESHIHADRALLRFINDKEITEAFDKIGKWYS